MKTQQVDIIHNTIGYLNSWTSCYYYYSSNKG